VDLAVELEQLLGAFEGQGVAYALVGGLALAVHGVVRATEDIDVLVPAEACDAARRVAHDLGFTVETTLRFSNGLEIRRLAKLVGEDALTLDLLLVDAGSQEAFASRERYAFGAGSVWVVSRQGLIGLKLAAGRDQDLADVRRLRELDG
jgi:hypothetical protein